MTLDKTSTNADTTLVKLGRGDYERNYDGDSGWRAARMWGCVMLVGIAFAIVLAVLLLKG